MEFKMKNNELKMCTIWDLQLFFSPLGQEMEFEVLRWLVKFRAFSFTFHRQEVFERNQTEVT